MKSIFQNILTVALIPFLASCSFTSGKHRLTANPHASARKVQPVRISNIDHIQGSQELMLHSMGLIGTPYKWGGSTTSTGFDCSGMIQFVYKNALGVSLPRTARDMAAASRKIPDGSLRQATSFSSTQAAQTNTRMSAYTSATVNSSMRQAVAKPLKPKNSPARFTRRIIWARIPSLPTEKTANQQSV